MNTRVLWHIYITHPISVKPVKLEHRSLDDVETCRLLTCVIDAKEIFTRCMSEEYVAANMTDGKSCAGIYALVVIIRHGVNIQTEYVPFLDIWFKYTSVIYNVSFKSLIQLDIL